MASRAMMTVALLAMTALLSCSRKPTQTESAPSAEAKAYVRSLQLSDVSMKATESYAKQVITEIEGKVTNAGNRTVEFAEVACVFYDSIGQVVLREKATIVRRPLRPGETQAFRLPFDDIPSGWNNQMPQLVVAQIRLS